MPELMSRKQVAEYFGVHVNTLDRWVRRGEFPPPIYVLGRLRWRRDDVERYVAEQTRLAKH